MAQENVGPIPFFPDTTSGRVGARRAKETGVSDADDQLADLGKADEGRAGSRPESRHDSFGKALKTAANRPSILKADKPKLGNREPFFPKTAMPYHPEPSVDSGMRLATSADRAMGDVYPVGMWSADEAEDIDAMDLELSVPDFEPIEDEDGLMMKSYDAAAVSYPVSRVAPEALDEETKADLDRQGLWELPTTVMAQPSSELAAMSAVEPVKPSAIQAVPVQKPITQFMASLESELGVSPDRLVKAFEKLPPGQMQLPPEQTMIQVVKNLNLESADQSKAMDLYSKMLAQMKNLEERAPSAEPMIASVPAAGSTKLLNGQREAATRYAQTGESPLSQPVKTQANQTVSVPTQNQDQDQNRVQNQVHAQTQVKQSQDAVTLTRDQVQSAKPGVEGQVPVSNVPSNAMSNGNTIPGGQPQPDLNNQGYGQSGQNQSFAQDFGKQSQGLKPGEMGKMKLEVKEKGASTPKSSSIERVDLSSQLASSLTPANPDTVNLQNRGMMDLSVAGADGAKGLNGDGMQAKQEAIQTIVNHAQLLAQKGGGEMQMTLKPDQLGEIQLKVALEGNRVDVQMVTERSDVKKLIEQGVQELRSGLAQHQLSMDKLDVSVSDKNTGSFKHGQPDFTAARDFANQFHQHQQARREQMFDLPGTGRGFNAARPVSRAMTPQAAVSRQGSSSGRLNVVA
jgi:flagellar hook-length control protein FliK